MVHIHNNFFFFCNNNFYYRDGNNTESCKWKLSEYSRVTIQELNKNLKMVPEKPNFDAYI